MVPGKGVNKMSNWTFEYAMNQARLVVRDNGKLHSHEFVENVLTPLIAKIDERAKNPGVWDEAPKNATVCIVNYAREAGNGWDLPSGELYFRELPKSKEEELAEETWRLINKGNDTPKNIILKAFSDLREQIVGDIL
jgi:hypothetical protein